jgi:hypothetical protein
MSVGYHVLMQGALKPCDGCGRSFNAKAYAVHQKICKKVFQTKRKPIDVAAMRAPDVPDAHQFLQQAKRDQAPAGKRGAPVSILPEPRPCLRNLPVAGVHLRTSCIEMVSRCPHYTFEERVNASLTHMAARVAA